MESGAPQDGLDRTLLVTGGVRAATIDTAPRFGSGGSETVDVMTMQKRRLVRPPSFPSVSAPPFDVSGLQESLDKLGVKLGVHEMRGLQRLGTVRNASHLATLGGQVSVSSSDARSTRKGEVSTEQTTGHTLRSETPRVLSHEAGYGGSEQAGGDAGPRLHKARFVSSKEAGDDTATALARRVETVYRNRHALWSKIPRNREGVVTPETLRRGLAEFAGVQHLGREAIDSVVSAAGGDANDADGISFKEFCDALEKTDRVRGVFAGFQVGGAATTHEPQHAQRARQPEPDGWSLRTAEGAEAEAELPEGEGEKHLETRRRLLSVLGRGVTPAELPPAGVVPARAAWGEPPDDGLHTLPRRSEAAVLAERRHHLHERLLGHGGDEQRAAGKRALTGILEGVPGEDPLAGPAAVPEVSREQRLNRGVRATITDRIAQLFGGGPRGIRKAFVRFARATDGTTSLAAAAEGLRQLGVGVTATDIARLVHEGAEAADADAHERDAGAGAAFGGLTGASKLDYVTFARALERLDAAPSTIPAPFVPPVGLQNPPEPALTADGPPGAGAAAAAGGARSVVSTSSAAAAAALAKSGLQHRDRAVRDICQRVANRLSVSGLAPSRIFLKVDAQRDGMLTHEEVRTGLRSLGVELTDDELGAFVGAVDPRRSGLVDYTNFVQALFPPDIDPFERPHPLPAGDGGVRGFGKRRAALATAAGGGGGGSGSTPPRGGGLSVSFARTATDLDAMDAEDEKLALQEARRRAEARGLEPGEPEEWEGLPEVTEDGVYVGPRPGQLDIPAASELRLKHFNSPAPFLQGTIARDTRGMPAAYLAAPGAAAAEGGDARAPTRELALRKKENEILRRVSDTLSTRGNARELFMKLNRNHDASVSLPELREGLARLGVALNSTEFRILLRTMDSDNSGSIQFAEFARLLRQDDPVADSTDAPTRIAYAPHRYRPPLESEALLPYQGVPRLSTDSRAVQAALQAPPQAQARAVAAQGAADGAEGEVRMVQEVVDRIITKAGSLRDVFLRLPHADRGTVRAADLRRGLLQQGIHLSQRQVDAFLAPLLAHAASGAEAGVAVDYPTFLELARPRAVVEGPGGGGGPGELQSPSARVAAARGTLRVAASRFGDEAALAAGVAPGDGLGRFGAAPRVPDDDATDVRRAEFARYTNTDPYGIWNPAQGDPSRVASAVGTPGATVAALAVAEEHHGLPTAGAQPLRRERVKKGEFADKHQLHERTLGVAAAIPHPESPPPPPPPPPPHAAPAAGRQLDFSTKVLHPTFRPLDISALAARAADAAARDAARHHDPPAAPHSAAKQPNPALMMAAGVRSTERVQRDHVERDDAGKRHWGAAATAFAETGGLFQRSQYPL